MDPGGFHGGTDSVREGREDFSELESFTDNRLDRVRYDTHECEESASRGDPHETRTPFRFRNTEIWSLQRKTECPSRFITPDESRCVSESLGSGKGHIEGVGVPKEQQMH